MRLDVYIASAFPDISRSGAQRLIAQGKVKLRGITVLKCSESVFEGDSVDVDYDENAFVSRGGLKLEKALDVFDISVTGAVAIDVGASSGGFTDCLLRRGAAMVYAVDVGHSQLAPSLALDKHVINMERTDIRTLSRENVPNANFASIDVSFISLSHVLPTMYKLLSDDGRAVALIKPQFEAGRAALNKKGVVRDKKTHAAVINSVCTFARDAMFNVRGLDFSPVCGGEGNIEYLIYLDKSSAWAQCDIKELVRRSHLVLEGH